MKLGLIVTWLILLRGLLEFLWTSRFVPVSRKLAKRSTLLYEVDEEHIQLLHN